MKNILITGITGFTGSHLAELYLGQADVQVHGTRKWRSDIDNVKHIADDIIWHECDITDSHSVESVIKTVKPDIIHHLAAISYVPASWAYPQRTMEVNLIGSINLFEAVKEHSPKTIVQIASSSETYGIPDKLPITEDMVLKPCSPYGVSKAAMDMTARQHFQSYGCNIIITRAFNHCGPRRGSEFVCSTFAKQIAKIEKGINEPIIKVGNLKALRDFTDVRDICIAYRLAIDKCNPGEPYNISSDKSVTIQSVLDLLLQMSDVKIIVEQDPARMRPSDLYKLEGDSTKFRKATGWQPKIAFAQSLEDLLNYWRERV